MDAEYDVVIVGSGVAGALCAWQLTQLGQYKILMLEAGDNGTTLGQRIQFHHIMDLQGNWTCKGNMGTHTATFTPLFGGKAMRIQEMNSIETVVFDSRRQKWIDQHIDSEGMYGTMEGAPLANGIDFTLVYPAAKAAGKVRMVSKTMQTTDFSMMQNGKMVHQRETCTKNS